MAHRAPVKLVSYSSHWPCLFEAERAVLVLAFPASEYRIEHIGSTSVPGLGAKPIIDVLIGASSLAEIDARIPFVEMLGYQYMPEHEVTFPQRRFFAKPLVRPRSFHLHAVAMDSPFFAEHLRFRDALRADPQLAGDYFALKVELAARFGDDREGYTDAKGPFIQAVLDRATSRPAS
jgi:GrpB-like predicted nucleotidyltransferase (UPF0157 family)